MGLRVGRKNGIVEIVFRQDLQDLLDFIFNFQFPDETENTQSPLANSKSSFISLYRNVSGVREINFWLEAFILTRISAAGGLYVTTFIWKVVTNKRIQQILLILSEKIKWIYDFKSRDRAG